MTRVFLHLVLLGVIGSAAAPAHVSAQPAPAPGVDKKQVARQYTEAGLAAAKLGDYDTAINFYQKAYQLVQHPTLIFDMAEAHRLAGRVDQATTLYKRYLSDAPTGPQAQDARDRIAEINAKRAEEARKIEEARKAEEDRKTAERRAEEDRKAAARKAEEDRRAAEAREAVEAGQERERAAAAAASPSGAPGATPPQDAPEAAAPPGRNLRIAGIATGAGGAVGVAIGIGFALRGRSLSEEVSKRYDPSKVNAGNRANTIAIVGTAGGTVLIAAGAALYWWGYTQGRSTERVSLAPAVSDRVAGLVIAGTWR